MPNSKAAVMTMAGALLVLGLPACTAKIDSRQTEEIKGLIYKLNSDEPFTGTISNYPTSLSFNPELQSPSCTVGVKDGLLDGVATCVGPAGARLSEATYHQGKKDGHEQKWDKDRGTLLLDAQWEDGRLVSALVYVPGTSALLLEQHWTQWEVGRGGVEGTSKQWSDDGKGLVADLTFKEGKRNGCAFDHTEFICYEAGYAGRTPATIPPGFLRAGTPSHQLGFEEIDPSLKACVTAKIDSYQKSSGHTVDANSPQLRQWRDECSAQASASPAGASNGAGEACLDAKIGAFHKEAGSDAVVSNDMLQEWQAQCGVSS